LVDYTGEVQLVLCELKYMCIGCHSKIEGISDSAKVRCGKCRMAQKKSQLGFVDKYFTLNSLIPTFSTL
jgi:hypothetical protein